MAAKNKSLSKSGVYYLIYNVLNVAFPFITGIYVARVLLPANIGEVGTAQNLARYFSILAFLGLPTYGMREIAKVREDRIERNRLFSELYIINLISTIVFASIYFIIISIVPLYRENFLLYAIVGISIVLNMFNISWLYEGMEEFRFISLRNILFKIVSFICLIILVKGPEDYYIYAAITVIGTAGNYVVNMLYSPKFATFTRRNLDLKRHLKPVFLLVTVNLAIEIYSLVDITMMGFLSTKESVAFYKYGHNIEKILLQIVNTFTVVLVPRISYYFKQEKIKEFNTLVSKAMKLIIITSVPMIIGVQFTADFLVLKMYGEQYVNSAAILKLFSVLLLISPIGYLLGSRMLLVTNNEKKMIICVGTGAVVNVIGNALMIPRLHEFGATFASIISEIVVMIVYVSFGRRYFRLIGMKETVEKVFLASIIMFIYLLLCSRMPLNGWIVLFLQISGAVLLYVGILLLKKEEIAQQYLTIILKKIKK